VGDFLFEVFHMLKVYIRYALAVALLCFNLFVIHGCSGNSSKLPDMGGEEGAKVALVIEDLNEIKHNAKRVSELFASKSGVPDSKKLNQFVFYVKGKPTVTGSTATCMVLIEKNDGTVAGELEWSFENVSGRWLIKSALMP
jgi:hypothetical protein